jgi:hypothetical protein
LGDDAVADAVHFDQSFGRRGNNVGKGAEFREQSLGDWFGIAPPDGAEQHQFQQFVIRKRTCPTDAKPVAQSVAMPKVIRLLICRGCLEGERNIGNGFRNRAACRSPLATG